MNVTVCITYILDDFVASNDFIKIIIDTKTKILKIEFFNLTFGKKKKTYRTYILRAF